MRPLPLQRRNPMFPTPRRPTYSRGRGGFSALSNCIVPMVTERSWLFRQPMPQLLASSARYARSCFPPMWGPDGLRLPFVELGRTIELRRSKTRTANNHVHGCSSSSRILGARVGGLGTCCRARSQLRDSDTQVGACWPSDIRDYVQIAGQCRRKRLTIRLPLRDNCVNEIPQNFGLIIGRATWGTRFQHWMQ